MKPLPASAWSFGGPLAGVPADTAWLLLGLLLALGILVAWISYRTAVVRAGVSAGLVLVTLRGAAFAIVILCLANPVHIEREVRDPPPPPPSPPAPPIVVVVDRSDSMTVRDNRGRTRLDDALATWRRLDQAAGKAFGVRHYHSFAEDLRPAGTLEEAAAHTGGTSETRLYRSLQALLAAPAADKPAAAVVLTDGIDTSNDRDERLRQAAVAAGVPVYFVVGTNRSARPEPFLRIREWRTPSVAMRNTVFTAEAVFEAFSAADRNVAFSVWQGDRRIHHGRLSLTTGANLVPRTFTINAADPGNLELTLRFGETAGSPMAARSITRVLERRAVRTLVYQGALDWGFRYLTNALRTDSNFEFGTIVTPEVGVSLARGTHSGGRVVGKLPEDPAQLAGFDCLVLAETRPEHLSRTQQRAIQDFVRRGGSLLFIAPMGDSVMTLAGGPLAEMLPVNLEQAGSPRRTGGGRDRNVSLVPLRLTDVAQGSPIFAVGDRGAQLVPRFAEFLPVDEVRPGAEVLAVHPTETNPVTRRPYVLLATQTFGRGRVTFLGTDALWRWKMSERSDSKAVETFWQQLILETGRRREPDSLYFTNTPAQVRVGKPVTLSLAGAEGEKAPVVAAKSPGGRVVPLTVKRVTSGDAPWTIEWTPDEAGQWEVGAGIAGAHRAHIFPNVIPDVTGELAVRAPALDALRTLAGETGGMLLGQELPPSWRAEAAGEKKPEPIVTERRTLLWNQANVLWIALGCFGLELLLRRLWRML